jgi:hypothetical protein
MSEKPSGGLRAALSKGTVRGFLALSVVGGCVLAVFTGQLSADKLFELALVVGAFYFAKEKTAE